MENVLTKPKLDQLGVSIVCYYVEKNLSLPLLRMSEKSVQINHLQLLSSNLFFTHKSFSTQTRLFGPPRLVWSCPRVWTRKFRQISPFPQKTSKLSSSEKKSAQESPQRVLFQFFPNLNQYLSNEMLTRISYPITTGTTLLK